MQKGFAGKLKATLIVPFGIFLVLVPFSLIVGWNFLTLLLFWFIIVPLLTNYLPTIVSKNKGVLVESLTGLVIFYGFMVFMIYKHYKTDYFQIMMVSCVINLVLIAFISAVKKESDQASSGDQTG